MRCFESLPKLSKSRSYGSGEVVGAGSRHHALRGTHKQRVSETSAQPCDGVAEGRLTEPYPACGTADMPLVDQRFKGKQKVKIDSANIHDLNITYYEYPLHN